MLHWKKGFEPACRQAGIQGFKGSSDVKDFYFFPTQLLGPWNPRILIS
jgi:hypothetical protein